MKDSLVDKLLCTTGYLPPRNEEEMMAFEKVFSQKTIRKDFHVDVDRIVNGGCCVRPLAQPLGSGPFSSSDMRMAARNYEALPKDVIEKIKKQHKGEDDKG